MLGPDGDLISRCYHRLPILQLLIVGYQPSLDKNAVQEDVDDDVVSGTNLSGNFLAAADDVLGIESQPGIAAPARRLHRLLCNELLSLPDAQEAFLDLPYDLHRLRAAVDCPPGLLEEALSIVLWWAMTFFRNCEDFVSENSLKK